MASGVGDSHTQSLLSAPAPPSHYTGELDQPLIRASLCTSSGCQHAACSFHVRLLLF